MTQIVTCKRCGGSGEIALSQRLQATLNQVPKHPKEARSTLEIAERLKGEWVKITAINNRLRELHRMRLVTVERRGKALYWSRCST